MGDSPSDVDGTASDFGGRAGGRDWTTPRRPNPDGMEGVGQATPGRLAKAVVGRWHPLLGPVVLPHQQQLGEDAEDGAGAEGAEHGPFAGEDEQAGDAGDGDGRDRDAGQDGDLGVHRA